jgi:hypothetical protein
MPSNCPSRKFYSFYYFYGHIADVGVAVRTGATEM